MVNQHRARTMVSLLCLEENILSIYILSDKTRGSSICVDQSRLYNCVVQMAFVDDDSILFTGSQISNSTCISQSTGSEIILEKNSSMDSSVFWFGSINQEAGAFTLRDSSVTRTKINALGTLNQMRLSVIRSTFQSNTVSASVGSWSKASIYFELSLVTDSAFVKRDGTPSSLNMTVVYSRFTNASISLDRAHVAIIPSYISINSPIRMGSGLIRCSVITTEIPSDINGITVGSSRDEYDTRSFKIINSTIAGFRTGIQVNGLTSVICSNNNFESNSLYNIENAGPNLIDAKRNWWGDAADSVIQAKIRDIWDDIDLGKISYESYTNRAIIQTCLPPRLG